MSVTQPSAHLWQLSIAEAGARFRDGSLSPVELTTATLDRIAATEPTLHAYVSVLADAAMASARHAETELRSGHDRGPLHGIPIGVKDIFDLRGEPTRCGSRVRADAPSATADAAVVAKLRAGGAILIGKTVTQEFAAGVVSDPARNPWDPTRIPGGSSGGSGAAVAAGSCAGALGSDTGGSIRIPAAVNGITGLKPTFGQVSTRGVFPYSWSLDTVGPLARSVTDAELIYQVIAGPSQGSGSSSTTTADQPQDLRGVRLGVPHAYFFDRLQPGVRTAVTDALTTLSELGAELVDVTWDDAKAARAVAYTLSRAEAAAFHGESLRRIPDRFAAELRTSFEAGFFVPIEGYFQALKAREVVRRSIAALFAAQRIEALVLPTLAATAVPAADLIVHYDDGDEPVRAAYTRFTQPFNATGQPVLSLPCGFDDQRLPVGLQVVGRPFAEAPLCQLGRVYQNATDWHMQFPPL